jgi:sortase A
MLRRGLGITLAVVGVLLVTDAVLTVVWKEPVTWFLTRNDQNRLEREFAELDRRLGAGVGVRAEASEPTRRSAGPAEMRRMRREAGRLSRAVGNGDAIGRLEIPSIDLSFIVVQGADPADLQLGPGHYTRTRLPAQPGTVGLAGHRTTYLQPFRRIDELTGGEQIVLTMPYGRFEYRVTDQRIVSPKAVGVLASRGRGQRLVLTACHPVFSAKERIIVLARLVRATPRGPAVA